MESHFEIEFPLILEHDDSVAIKYDLEKDDTLEFSDGIYYLCGDNGSGKTTFVNMLALIAGRIGEKAKNMGVIKFNGEPYNGDDFDYIRAAEIREKHFCIFPQKAFFLPVSTRDNYIILNGTEKSKEETFSPIEHPDLLSGGQQQKILMDLVLDKKKPVWFLDEPLTNMDAERRHYFWKALGNALKEGLYTIFFIDHWMEREIKKDEDFRYRCTLTVSMKYSQGDIPSDLESEEIEIYGNNNPEKFFEKQMRKTQREMSLKKKQD